MASLPQEAGHSEDSVAAVTRVTTDMLQCSLFQDCLGASHVLVYVCEQDTCLGFHAGAHIPSLLSPLSLPLSPSLSPSLSRALFLAVQGAVVRSFGRQVEQEILDTMESEQTVRVCMRVVCVFERTPLGLCCLLAHAHTHTRTHAHTYTHSHTLTLALFLRRRW